NRAHLSPDTPTVFERLDDADVRTAGTTYLMYRGRHRHEPQRDTALARVAAALMRHPVLGPRELFYADIFASRSTGCRSGLGMPGVRDRHSGCVSSYLVENDLFDFLLLSLPDNDWYSHKYGPEGQLHSIAQADLQLARVCDAVDGVEHVMWLARDAHDRPSEAIIQTSDRRELRFAPGDDARDARGLSWSLDGALAVIDAVVEDGRVATPSYPDALERVWSALTS